MTFRGEKVSTLVQSEVWSSLLMIKIVASFAWVLPGSVCCALHVSFNSTLWQRPLIPFLHPFSSSALTEPLKFKRSPRKKHIFQPCKEVGGYGNLQERERHPFPCWLHTDKHSSHYPGPWGPHPRDGRTEALYFQRPGCSEDLCNCHSSSGLLVPEFLCLIIKFYRFKSLLIWGFYYIQIPNWHYFLILKLGEVTSQA